MSRANFPLLLQKSSIEYKESTSGQTAKWSFVEQMQFLQNHFQESYGDSVYKYENSNTFERIVMKPDISHNDIHAFPCSS